MYVYKHIYIYSFFQLFPQAIQLVKLKWRILNMCRLGVYFKTNFYSILLLTSKA